MQASKKIVIRVETSNKPGMMAKVFSEVSKLGINIPAFIAWVENNKGEFRLLADDPKRLSDVLKSAGFKPQTEEIIVVKAENKAGAAWAIGGKLGDAGVNITKAFATSGSAGEGVVVLFTDDNNKAIEALI
jgi:hypothetical protein